MDFERIGKALEGAASIEVFFVDDFGDLQREFALLQEYNRLGGRTEIFQHKVARFLNDGTVRSPVLSLGLFQVDIGHVCAIIIRERYGIFDVYRESMWLKVGSDFIRFQARH